MLENLKIGAYNRGAREKEGENLEYVFKLFPKLERFKKRQTETLSGGEARMLAVGRGLMSNAKLLVVDEPSAGLAPNVRSDMFESIREINKSGIVILLVEQNFAEASKFAHRMYLIEDGRLTKPVKGATITGTGIQALKDIDMLGSDFVLNHSPGRCGKGQEVPVGVGMPTLRVKKLTVGGTGSSF